MKSKRPAQTWGAHFAMVLRERGWTVKQASEELGHNVKTLGHWKTGRSMPQHHIAVEVSDALDRPRLASLSLELRTKVCAICDVTFTDAGRYMKAMYCSGRCANVANLRRIRGLTREREALADRRLRIYQAAVDAYCRECEPEGVCRTPECAIQMAGISPLRLEKRRVA